MSTDIRVWYEFTLAQMAADSYLDNLLSLQTIDSNVDLIERLQNGANHYNHISQNIADDNLSATRMTDVMIIDDFFKTWEIIDHLPNTESGFSATLLKNKITGEFTFSIRSTESKDSEDGGDVESYKFSAPLILVL